MDIRLKLKFKNEIYNRQNSQIADIANEMKKIEGEITSEKSILETKAQNVQNLRKTIDQKRGYIN